MSRLEFQILSDRKDIDPATELILCIIFFPYFYYWEPISKVLALVGNLPRSRREKNAYLQFYLHPQTIISPVSSLTMDTSSQTYTIQTAHTNWIFSGDTGSTLLQSTFGKSVPETCTSAALAVYPVRNLSALLEPSLCIIQPDGTHNLELQLAAVSESGLDDNASSTVFHLADPAYPVDVDLIITAYFAEDVITSRIRVINKGSQEIMLLDRDSAFVRLPYHHDTRLTSFYGCWGKEMTGFHEDRLPRGITKHVNSQISRAAVPDYPGCYLSFGGPAQEDSGDVFAAAVAWTGSWEYSITNTENDEVFFSAGTLPALRKLAPGRRYESPNVVMTWSSQGKGQASRNLHDYGRNYGIYNGKTERPVVLNSWEGLYMDFNEEIVTALIHRAAEAGAEYFVLDDGWFGNGKYARNQDTCGLGDWQVNREKLPHGIEYLCDECENVGLRFGIWVEPEMICPLSELFENHPDYAMQLRFRDRVPMRNQYNLDLTNREVESFVYNTVASLLSAHPRIAYIKWDHNATANVNPGSPANPDDQGALNDRFTEAYYRIISKLRNNFPSVIFQACSSGGMRGDLGTLQFSEEFWGSDETNALDRILIQWGWSHFFPSKAIASHIGRYKEGDFKLRADVAMTARLGIELDPKILSDADFDTLKQGVAEYKKIRPLIHSADLYRGRSPHDSQVTELTFVAKDKSQAVFFGFKRHTDPHTENLLPRGIDASKIYRLTELNPDTAPRIVPGDFSGADLLANGIPVSFPSKQSSVVVRLDAI